jgi:hypothetical protein
MVFNATFNNIFSYIMAFVLLEEKTGGPGKKPLISEGLKY